MKTALLTTFFSTMLFATALVTVPLSQQVGPANKPPACCKVCRKGKACGDSCISRKKSCHKQPGCACNG